MYKSPLMCTGMWPHRGARQLLSHSQRHDVTAWDRTWMDLQSGQCQRCRAGAVGPLLNPGMAWGCHTPGADVHQHSSELVVQRRLSQSRLFLRAAASLRASLRGTGLL